MADGTVLVFLDFDGVLRRLSSRPDQFDPDCLASFEDTIRRFADVRIVISSSWRLGMPLREIRGRFSPDVRRLIAGVTPEAQRLTRHYRHGEVETYLRREGLTDEPWIAVDDDPAHFPERAPTTLTDADRGFDTAAAESLRVWLEARTRAPVTHCAGLAFRTDGGTLEIMLVTSRQSRRWIAPKGRIEPDHTIAEAVVQEVYEEGGLKGQICTVPAGRVRYRKHGEINRELVYLFRIEELLDDWEERSSRERRFVPFDETGELIERTGLRRLASGLPRLLEATRNFPWLRLQPVDFLDRPPPDPELIRRALR